MSCESLCLVCLTTGLYTGLFKTGKNNAMSTYIDIGAYDAKTHFPEYLRKVQSGVSFRITNRGEHVADLVPPGTMERQSGAEAAARMQQFVKAQSLIGNVNIKALIEEGRD